jgi:two-component system, OmpR family, sensor histidine kinase KdpD
MFDKASHDESSRRISGHSRDRSETMTPSFAKARLRVLPRAARWWLLHFLLSLLSVLVTTGVAIAAFRLHFNLSAVGSLYLLLVVFVALRWGFVQATVISVAAVFCMNYLFIPPIFEFQVADPENWIAVVTFETAALLVSGLSSKLRMHAAQVELERARTAKLYELSRAILLVDGQRSTSEQLSKLIQEIVGVDAVELWDIYEGESPASLQVAQTESALETFLAKADRDDPELRVTRRVLRVGTTPIGGLVLSGWESDSELADAIASLAAVAFERAHALHKENRAEAERNTERLRTAVLDGLAHGFKTPLTAIQTASSGLLAIDPQLTNTQAELVSIIDEQVTALTRLTTRLLQTAALEAGELRLRRSKASIQSLLEDALVEQDDATRARVRVSVPPGLVATEVDAQMVHLALIQLLDNAAKYSAGESPIWVAVTQDSLMTTVEVANRGSSISQEERDLIFERFYRGGEAAYGPSGSGVGLSIVKKTAEAHGGRAWVESKDDTTHFYLTLEHREGEKHD